LQTSTISAAFKSCRKPRCVTSLINNRVFMLISNLQCTASLESQQYVFDVDVVSGIRFFRERALKIEGPCCFSPIRCSRVTLSNPCKSLSCKLTLHLKKLLCSGRFRVHCSDHGPGSILNHCHSRKVSFCSSLFPLQQVRMEIFLRNRGLF
jgi:hypothetical protein